MRKILVILAALAFASTAFADPLQQYLPGYRTIDGSQLNLMVDVVNNITGQGTPQAITGTTGAFSGAVTATISTTVAAPSTTQSVRGKISVGPTITMTSGNIVGTRGEVNLPSGTTVNNAADYLYGVQGKFIGGGTMTQANICGVCAQIDASAGTYTAGVLSGLWIDMGATASSSAVSTNFGGASQLLRMTNTTAAITSQLFDIYANATLFAQIDAPSHTIAYFASAGTGASSCGVSTGAVAAKVLHITVAGTDYWIPLCSSNS